MSSNSENGNELEPGDARPESVLTGRIIAAAIEVHRNLGPGFDRVFETQILTYMRHAQKPLGLLINFNTPLLKNGIKRYTL